MHGTVIPRVTARMIFGRVNENRITLRGEASRAGTEIPPVEITKIPLLDEPIILRLEVDTEADTYRIGSRATSESEFTFYATGRAGAEREANYLYFNPLNDYAADNEFLKVDRIELQSINTSE